MTSTISPADRKPSGSVMWLWQAHNMANSRLHGDVSEDPKFPKVQFPTKHLCSECYKDDDIMDKNNVFNFLRTFYGKDGIIFEEQTVEVNTVSKTLGKEIIPAQTTLKDLDWWELHQRKKDLEKIRALRNAHRVKSKSRQESKLEQLGQTDIKQSHDNIRVFDLKVSSRYSWGFTNIDMGMCLTFYIMCSVVILVLYYHFIVRKKYRPFKCFY